MRSRTSGIINSSSSGVKESPATRAAPATSAASTRPSPWTGSAAVDAVKRRVAAIMGQSHPPRVPPRHLGRRPGSAAAPAQARASAVTPSTAQ